MDQLRWILLFIGLGVILAVYAVTRYQIRRRQKASGAGQPTATVTHSGADIPADDAAVEAELERMGSLLREEQGGQQKAAQTPARPAEQQASRRQDGEQLIVLSVMAAPGDPFRGPALIKAFDNTALQHSDMKIYQRLNERAEPVYGVASAVKPGVFDLNNIEHFTTPGLTLFLQLPGPVDGVTAFDDMLTTAERLAVELGGEIQDQHHNVLSRQMVAHLRDGIINASLQTARTAP